MPRNEQQPAPQPIHVRAPTRKRRAIQGPRKTNHSCAPKSGNVRLLLDSNGRQTVSLERRASGITIENREQGAASLARYQRIKGASQ